MGFEIINSMFLGQKIQKNLVKGEFFEEHIAKNEAISL